MSSSQAREGRKRASTAASSPPVSQQKKRQKAATPRATVTDVTDLVDVSALPRDYKHRIGSAFIGFPMWQVGSAANLHLGKAQKRVVTLLKDLCKRKGGQFFSMPVDPVDQGLDDYFDIVTDPLDLGTVVKAVEKGFYSRGAGGVSWHQRLARDVAQVWSNALQYNPPGNVVSEAAKELRDHFSQQLAKIVQDAEEAGEAELAGGEEELVQLAMDDFTFRDGAGRLLGLEALLERGCGGVELSGLLLRNRRTGADRREQGHAGRLAVLSVRVEHLEAMDGDTGAWVALWARTEGAWVRLLGQHPCWEPGARAALGRLRLAGLVARSFGESPRDAPERVVRGALKAVLSKAATKAEEERAQQQLLEGAEYAALCVERVAEEGKTGKEAKKLQRRLLHDAEKERAKRMCAEAGGGLVRGGGEDGKSLQAVCGALAAVVSKVEMQSMRSADAEGLAQPAGVERKKGGVARNLAEEVAAEGKEKGKAAREKKSHDAGATPAKEKKEKEAAGAVVHDPTSGYWERDAAGVRQWVSNAPETAAGEAEEKTTVSRGNARRKRAEEVLAESPLAYEPGARVAVLFDDQQWYVGNITAFDPATRLFHVEFSENDVDDIAMPDPDVVLVCPVELLLLAVDEAAEAFRRGLKALLQHQVGADLAGIADDLRKKMHSQHRSYKDVIGRGATGKVPQSNWTVEGVKAAFSSRMQAKFAEVGMEAKHWDVLAEAVAAFEQEAAQKEKAEQSESAPEPKTKKAAQPEAKAKTPGKKKGKGDAMEIDEAKRSPSDKAPATVAENGAPSTSKKGKRKHADEAADTPASKKGSASHAETEVQDGKDMDKARSDWSNTPDWLKKNSMVELEWDGDWWQAKAVKCVHGKVRCNYVGSDDFEWISFKSDRLRPPSEDWDKVISGAEGEVVEVRRKVGARNKWVLATVLNIEEKRVRVEYSDDGAQEWVTLDAKTIRPMETEGASEKPAEEERPKERRSIVVKPPTRSPWPEGTNPLAKWGHECVGACLAVKHFLAVFGKSGMLSQDPEGLEKATVALGAMPEAQMLESMADKSGVSDWVVALFVRALAVVVKQEGGAGPVVPPDSLNWPAWLQRMLERDILERGRRMIKDRLEESYVSEEALADHRIQKAALSHRGKPIQFPDPSRPYEQMDGEEVFVQGGPMVARRKVTGHLAASAESGVQVVCEGVHMHISDFVRFCGVARPEDDPPAVRVRRDGEEECTLAQWEASLKEKTLEEDGEQVLRRERGGHRDRMQTDDVLAFGGRRSVSPRRQDADDGGRAGGGTAHGLFFAEDAGDHLRAFEALLGAEVFKRERELADTLGKVEWAEVGAQERWRGAAWVCDAVAETEAFRAEVQEHSAEGEKAGSTTTGWTLFLAKKGGMKNAKEASELWKADEAVRTEFNDKARALREQENLQKSAAKEARRDALPLPARQQPLGSDNCSRRYWWTGWADCTVAVEKPVHAAAKASTPYPFAGSSRTLPYAEDPEWTFYDAAADLDKLEVRRLAWRARWRVELMSLVVAQKYLDEEDELERRVLKQVRNERAAAAAEALKSDPSACTADSDKPNANAAAPAEPAASAPAAQTAPAPISVLPSAPPGVVVPQQPGGGAGAVSGGGLGVSEGPAARRVPDNVLEKFPHRGEYFAREDETPVGIAEAFGVDAEALVEINKSLYAGLHARARFKAGTLLILPAPTVQSLARSPLRPRERVLADAVGLLLVAMQVVPLSVTLTSALLRLAECVRKPGGEARAAVEALADLEHAMLLPRERATELAIEDRLLPAKWLKGRREAWMAELEKARTWAQVGLLLQEFHAFGLDKISELRQLSTTRWSFRIECQRAIRPGAPLPPANDSNQPGLVLIPMKGEIVVYLRRGHVLHLDHYTQRPWDAVPAVPVASCIVEDTWFFKGVREHVPFCALQLRPIFQNRALVGKQILIGELPPSAQPRPLPAVCWVADWREATQTFLPSAPGTVGGPGPAPQAAQKVVEYLLRWDTGGPDCWVCLERAKYQLVRPEEAGPPFFVTVHYEQVLPEFLVTLRTFRESERVWAKGTGVRMWWRDDDHKMGGEYYTGEVLEQREGEDPWDSVHVRWDRDGDDDWVCPWELQVWTGPRVQAWTPAKEREIKGEGAEVEQTPGVISSTQQAAGLADAGTHTVEKDDETANQIAQLLGVDAELLVQMNRGALSGLTKHAKLHKNTKLRIPPKGLRFERPAQNKPSTANIPVVSAQRMFPQADEVWWEGGWTDEKLQICQVVLRRMMRHRHSSAFLEPVDHKALGLEDYLDVVSQPMDLGTIAKKVDDAAYAAPADFRADVVLVFENAKRYNPAGEREHQNAVLMLDMFEEAWREEKDRPEGGGRRRQ